jgi:hypothetical protein
VNPELEQLLVAMQARDNASPAEFEKAEADLERLLQPILTRLSPTGRGDFMRALQDRYRAYIRANQRPPTLPQ